ncbi:MAG: glycoside hydrolase family 9 protein [Oscillospiraceae bacterium]|nr:glycoside hydrolase family 9 protein [Oscillospiraceae bacterium]
MRGKCKAIALSMACAMMLSAFPLSEGAMMKADAAQNMISNSTFDTGTSGWGTYKESGGKCSLSTEGGKLAFNITDVGTLNYSVQMFYDIVPLYQNAKYRLSFEISCTTPRFVESMIQQNGGTYQAYTWKGLDLTTQPQKVDYTFTMEQETDVMAKLVFNCGNQKETVPAHTIYLDNVVLELIDDSNVNYESNMPYAPDIITNQVGYKPDATKIATFRDVNGAAEFSVVNADSKAVVHTGKLYGEKNNASAGEVNFLGDFSEVTTPGTYYITCNGLDDSYKFTISEDVYTKLFDDSIKMLYLQRCGCEVKDAEFGHAACHTGTATILGTNQTIDVTGGWHDAGDYGRYIVPAAKSIADLLYAYDANPELFGDNLGIPESNNGIPDVLDEARYELEWMLKMQASNGGVYHKVSCANFPGYIMPEKETGALIVTPVSTTATADFCASMALAYEFYKDVDADFANKCMKAAENAWKFLEANPDIIFENPAEVTTGSYEDTSDRDERYWAAAQMYRATGDQKYLTALENLPGMFKKLGLDWAVVADYGNIALLTMDGVDKSSSAYATAKQMVTSQADTFAATSANSPYGVAIDEFNWGSNMTVANSGIILDLAYDLTGDEKYRDAACAQLDYLLGKNPNATCFVTGYGTVAPQNPHHRPSMAVGKAMGGMLVGGVNSNLEDSAAKAYLANVPPAKCFVDHSESYSTNEITIYWNSPLTYLMALVDRDAEASAEPVKGDANADGEFTVVDIIMVQRYLLGAGELTNAANCDLCEDGKINAFDLAAMKKLYFQ